MKKIHHFLIIIILLIAIYPIQAQVTTSIVNQRTYGGSLTELLTCGIKTTGNGFIIGGSSESGISGDKTDPNKGLDDIWILRLNPDLSIKWQKTIGGNDIDGLGSIIECKDGGFICLGLSYSPVSGDKTVANYGDRDYWVVKIDSSGNIQWQNVYGGAGSDAPSSIIRLSNGKYLIGGTSESDSSGVKTQNSRGMGDYWIVCIDSLGNKLWDKTIGGSQGDASSQITQVSANGILLAGTSFSPVSGEKSQPSFGGNDYWLVKIDTNGNVLWDKTFGGNNQDVGASICYENNYIYLSCYSNSDISGTKTEPCIGSYDYWILKLDAEGNKIWDKTIGGTANDLSFSISLSTNSELLIAGSSGSDISGDKTENSYGLSDFWVVALDTNGSINWQKTIGGSDYDECNMLVEIANNNYMLFGNSSSGISGLKTDACRGVQDYWVVEIATNFGIENNFLSEQNLKLYPNPVINSFVLEYTLEQNEVMTIGIYDINGKLIKAFLSNTKINKGRIKEQLDIRDLQSGIYIVRISSDSLNNNIKLIKL